MQNHKRRTNSRSSSGATGLESNWMDRHPSQTRKLSFTKFLLTYWSPQALTKSSTGFPKTDYRYKNVQKIQVKPKQCPCSPRVRLQADGRGVCRVFGESRSLFGQNRHNTTVFVGQRPTTWK